MAKLIGYSGADERNDNVTQGYHQSYYTQAIGQVSEPAIGGAMVPTGSYYGQQPEHLTYPNQPGSPQYSGMGYGQDPNGGELPPMPEQPPPLPQEPPPAPAQSGYGSMLGKVGYVLSTVGAAAGAYHGYKRNKSVGWAIGWFIFGGALPILAVPLALAQGYGKRKVGR